MVLWDLFNFLLVCILRGHSLSIQQLPLTVNIPFLGEYMIVITDRKRLGQLRGQDIYRITSFQILPLVKNLNSLSSAQVHVGWLLVMTSRKMDRWY
jgi:hypothetical protein